MVSSRQKKVTQAGKKVTRSAKKAEHQTVKKNIARNRLPATLQSRFSIKWNTTITNINRARFAVTQAQVKKKSTIHVCENA